MRTFKDFMQENMGLFQGPNDPRSRITQMHNLFTTMEPDDITDSHDLLLKLQR
jgi:hypothetical protein